MAELNELEQDELNERLAGAEHVPLHRPAGTSKVEDSESFTPFLHSLQVSILIYCHRAEVGRGGRGGETAQGITSGTYNVTVLTHQLFLSFFASPLSLLCSILFLSSHLTCLIICRYTIIRGFPSVLLSH